MKITVYEDENGNWSLQHSPNAREVTAELAEGFHALQSADDLLFVEGPPGAQRMRVEEAIQRNILNIPLLND